MNLAGILAEIAQLFWPARCAGCNGYVPAAALFCGGCAVSVTPLVDACAGCALPLPDTPSPDVDGRVGCDVCHRVAFAFGGADAACAYGAALADAIVAMKHRGRRDLARRLARLLVAPLGSALVRAGFGAADAIAPVPLHPRKLRRRGFNQALELARGARRLLASGRAGAPPRIEPTLLRRTRDTRELGHLGPSARRREVAGAFAVTDTARVRGRRVLLIDDVFTTGATLNECARVLRAAGAADVRVVALARAV